jgi:hypothetical protein
MAVSIGLLLLTVVCLPVNTASLIVNTLMAVGTFAAAGAAVWVAISGRTQAKDERDAADRAQARLVLVYVVPLMSHITVTVNNLGDRSILDVTCEKRDAKSLSVREVHTSAAWRKRRQAEPRQSPRARIPGARG